MRLLVPPGVTTPWYGLALLAQRVVTLRPPAGSLRRGWVVAPPGVTSILIALAVLSLLALALHARLRRRPLNPRR